MQTSQINEEYENASVDDPCLGFESPLRVRTGASSKVNFSKLSNEEKE